MSTVQQNNSMPYEEQLSQQKDLILPALSEKQNTGNSSVFSSSCVVADSMGQASLQNGSPEEIPQNEDQKSSEETREGIQGEKEFQDSESESIEDKHSKKRKMQDKAWEDEGEWPGPLTEEELVIREQVMRNQLKQYVWSDETRADLAIPSHFQDAVPLEKEERKKLFEVLPSFTKSFPCTGLKSLGDQKKFVTNQSDVWFLEKAAPKLHEMLVEELGAMVFLYQECGDDPRRLGLDAEELQELLKRIITSHVDVLKMIANMQIQRALAATSRSPLPKEGDKLKEIISDKVKLEEKKRAEAEVAYKMSGNLFPARGAKAPNRGAWRGTRRPRQIAGYRSGNGLFGKIAWGYPRYPSFSKYPSNPLTARTDRGSWKRQRGQRGRRGGL